MIKDFLITALLLITAFLSYTLYEQRIEKVTYIEFSYSGIRNERVIDWVYWDKPIDNTKQLGNVMVEISHKFKRDDVVIHNWKVLYK